MSFLEYRVKFAPTGIRKILYLNWPLVLLVTAVASVGFLMLYSIAGGNLDLWARPQMERFGVGMVLMFIVAMIPIWFWRSMSGVAYIVAFLLLLVVEFFGAVGMGAQRWIDLGFIRLQPSEMMKFTLVMLLAVYYDWLDPKLVSRPLYVLLPVLMIVAPTVLVLMQPNLGTSLMLLLAGATVVVRDAPSGEWIRGFVDFLAREAVTLANLPASFWYVMVEEMARGGFVFGLALR
ncbi:MAG: FtsW/RodA/SpoVE family cell cycle protein, partial [Tabrizicola sp.]